jgi:ketosteroid isomerase-like protein
VPVTQRTAYVYTVREGKVSRVEVWRDREEALEAAGLSE